jgi:hypothetical protein
MGNNPGFAAAGTGQHERGPASVLDSNALLRIQGGQNIHATITLEEVEAFRRQDQSQNPTTTRALRTQP